MISACEVVAKVCDATFDKPLVTNIFRGYLVEAIVALALEPEWTWCSQDYYSWDFETDQSLRLEVKQSAARQTWAAPSSGRKIPRFDVRPRKCRWEGLERIDEIGRYAHIYVFAYHDLIDETADHRIPGQWKFFVVPTSHLPNSQSISLKTLIELTDPVRNCDLRTKVGSVANTVHTQ